MNVDILFDPNLNLSIYYIQNLKANFSSIHFSFQAKPKIYKVATQTPTATMAPVDCVTFTVQSHWTKRKSLVRRPSNALYRRSLAKSINSKYRENSVSLPYMCGIATNISNRTKLSAKLPSNAKSCTRTITKTIGFRCGRSTPIPRSKVWYT